MTNSMNDEWKKLPPDLFPKINELPGDLAQLATIIDMMVPGMGVAVVIRIALEFRGTTIYCHNMDALTRKARDRWVREHFDAGDRVPDIARAVNLSERRVWEILGTEPVNDKQGRLW
ncbi:MAG: Mor transcription activator family protein [Deltaproteobacteria bacterium]|jgi:Mor family transcriptional regulator|nr:Mor transcription activator family protein [Deltaproteobacteria bacterium]